MLSIHCELIDDLKVITLSEFKCYKCYEALNN